MFELALSTAAAMFVSFRNSLDIFLHLQLYPALVDGDSERLVDRMSDNVKPQVVSPSAFTTLHRFPFS